MATTNPQGVVLALRQVLADTMAFSFRAQGYHWNVTGPDFSEYHALFGGIYEDVYGSVDAVAENILKVGSFSPYLLSEFAATTMIPDAPRPSTTQGMAADLLAASEQLTATLMNAFEVCDAANQQGIADFLAGRIDMQQKWSWQLRASAGLFRDVMVSEAPVPDVADMSGMKADDLDTEEKITAAIAELKALRDSIG